jgi:hypothetical protein
MTGGTSIEDVVMQYWDKQGQILPDVHKMSREEIAYLIEGIPSGCYDELLDELRWLSENKEG